MHPIGKIISGLVLIIVGLALFALPSLQIVDWLGNFIIIVTGSIPILLIIIGLFVVWLEADELKVEKELEKEEKKSDAMSYKSEIEKPKAVKKVRRKKRGRKKKTEPEKEETSIVDEM
ncbi:MAG: hypothetical protein GXO64_05155 [Candidatus Micrarchaeota archaeon]|nr:hypothetical protein [Candidatus Micrarchaeota archaeon]